LQGSRPVFFYTLSQNVHISIAWSRPPPPNRTYPGFFPQVAAGVERLYSCFVGFIDFLKRTGRYDDSIIILLSDHGDSLGEEGRWGHAYVIVPEIIRIPLIIHIPAALRGQMSARSRFRPISRRRCTRCWDTGPPTAARCSGGPCSWRRTRMCPGSGASNFFSRRAMARCTACFGATAASSLSLTPLTAGNGCSICA